MPSTVTPRGELRIYLGAAPGVGKTYAMLNEGRRRRDRGTDVIVGYVETHDRPQTVAQLGDLEILERTRLDYRGQTFTEFDLDAALQRRPEVILVDELAHTNVVGSRHAKRWHDVQELLDAGIDVITTMNVQHLESLNDVVAQITGITQMETVPDTFVRAAEQIELIDMTPEALRRRLAHGNVYASDKVDAALSNYFRVGNLGALRELALLWVADSVDDGIDSYRRRHGITDTWETRERVLVALTGAPGGDRLVRRGARLAARAHAELVGVHIRSQDGLAAPDPSNLISHRELLTELGGRYIEAVGGDIADTLVEVARSENVTQIVLGATRRSRWAELLHGSVINRVIGNADTIDVHVISPRTGDDDLSMASTTLRPSRRRMSRRHLVAWAAALFAVPLLAFAMSHIEHTAGTAGVLMVLLLGPVVVAMIGGRAPSIVAGVVGFVAADYFLMTPERSLRVAGPEDVVTLVVFVVITTTVSVLVDRLRARTAEVLHERTAVESLARLAQSTAVLDERSLDRLTGELQATLNVDSAAVLSRSGDGWHVDAGAGDPLPQSPSDATYSAELAHGTTLVVSAPSLTEIDRRLLTAFVAHVRLAQSTLALQAEAMRSEALSQANDLRDALLAAVSHDFRAPLASIKAAATSLTSDDVTWHLDDVRSFATTIDTEVDRLTALVENLLDMSRLQTGMLGVQRSATAPVDVVYAALASLSEDTSTVSVEVSETLPLIDTDPVLLERALANIVRNAVAYSPSGALVRVEAVAVDDEVSILIVDHGPGIAREKRLDVFAPFQRLGDGGTAAVQGIGLGLAVARGVCDAIDASITLDDTPGGGTTVTVTVPRSLPDAAKVANP